MNPGLLKEVERLAKKENRTLSELVREALRQYQQNRQLERRGIDVELLTVLRAVQEDAERKGPSKMSMREINAEIAAYRKEQRKKKTSKEPAA